MQPCNSWKLLAFALALFSCLITAPAEKIKPALDGTSADMWGGGGVKTNLIRGAWLKNSRFAMFIHWGLFSELGGEWNGKTYYGIAEWLMKHLGITITELE